MTYEVTRLASGDVTAYALLNTASYVIADWTRTSDMSASIDWTASMPEYGMRAPFAGGLELGSGRLTGGYSGIIEFFLLTAQMQEYLYETILSSSPIGIVTVYAYDDLTRTQAVFTGELLLPYVANSEVSYKPSGHTLFGNNQLLFRGGTKKLVSVIGTETTDVLLATELGYIIGLETQS